MFKRTEVRLHLRAVCKGHVASQSSVQKYTGEVAALGAVFKSAKVIQHLSHTQSKVGTCMASWLSQNESVAAIYLCCCIANSWLMTSMLCTCPQMQHDLCTFELSLSSQMQHDLCTFEQCSHMQPDLLPKIATCDPRFKPLHC